MTKAAFIFPGQGTQVPGMGQILYENVRSVRKYFDEAGEMLGHDLIPIMREGPEELLNEGQHCQPALYIHQFALAMLQKERLAASHTELRLAFGLSLGELTALAVAGVYDFATGLQLAHRRGILMQEASEQHPGGMLALLGASPDEVRQVCEQTGAEMANFNTPSQIVLAGTVESLREAEKLARSLSFSRVIPLKVAGASHCSLLGEARRKFHDYLGGLRFKEPEFPVIQNVEATETTNPEKIKKNLEAQLTSPVLWCQSMQRAAALGFMDFYECGVGKTLRGMARQIDPQLQVFPVSEADFIPKMSESPR
ncbi:MAG: ACP S-malonyltransferase [Puniceicoccales bacterium]|jgi:[acyl-carrier-protein] S-malonyltransferase|nr:ACP S-malonyltransferase [Puniceicoccales bacterium]